MERSGQLVVAAGAALALVVGVSVAASALTPRDQAGERVEVNHIGLETPGTPLPSVEPSPDDSASVTDTPPAVVPAPAPTVDDDDWEPDEPDGPAKPDDPDDD